LVHSPYFKTNIVEIEGEMNMDYSNLDSFVIYMCVEGSLQLECLNKTYTLNKGESILIPAAIDYVKLTAEKKSRILEASL